MPRSATTIPDELAPPKPDLAARDLTGPVPTYRPVSDITYLRTGQGWLSLATVVGLNARMVAGWACVRAHDHRHSPPAPGLARRRGHKAEGPSSKRPQQPAHLEACGVVGQGKDVRLACGGTGGCHDNAVAEPLFATLKARCTTAARLPRARRRSSP